MRCLDLFSGDINNLVGIFRDLRGFWRKLGDLGALGITAHSKYGGTEAQYLDHAIIMEELSR